MRDEPPMRSFMLVCYGPARLLALVAEWLSEQHPVVLGGGGGFFSRKAPPPPRTTGADIEGGLRGPHKSGIGDRQT